MDKNLRVGGRFVDKDDNLLVVVEVPCGGMCVGCFYKGKCPGLASLLGRPLCRNDQRDDGKSVIFIPTTEPAQEKPSGRTVAEIQDRIADMVAGLGTPKALQEVGDYDQRAAVRDALVDLSCFIDPPEITFLEAARHRVDGKAVRRRGWGGANPWKPGSPPCGISDEDINGTDWEIVPETNTDGS